jgi:hypothetical protein
MDTLGNMAALTEISAIKVVAPTVLQNVVDMAIQFTVVKVCHVILR